MKVLLSENQNSYFNNSNVRWYLSSQEIWIGHEKNYNEIEEVTGNSYGSFNWLYSSADTMLFDKDTLEFRSGVFKINEPIKVSYDKLLITDEKEGTIKLAEGKNSNCVLCEYSIYYPDVDILMSFNEKIRPDEWISTIQVTKDFSFIIKDDETSGILLKNALRHILKDEYDIADTDELHTNHDKNILVQYLLLIEKLNDELTSEEEKKLESDFRILFEQIKNDSLQNNAVKDSIANILDYM